MLTIHVKSTYAVIRCPDEGEEIEDLCIESTVRFAFVRNAGESTRRTFAQKVVELDQTNMAKLVYQKPQVENTVGETRARKKLSRQASDVGVTEDDASIRRLVDGLLGRRQPVILFSEVDERRHSHARIVKNLEFVGSLSVPKVAVTRHLMESAVEIGRGEAGETESSKVNIRI